MKRRSQVPAWQVSKKKSESLFKNKDAQLAPVDPKMIVCVAVDTNFRMTWFGEWPDWSTRLAIFHESGVVVANQLMVDQVMVLETNDKKFYVANKIAYFVALAEVLFHNAIKESQVLLKVGLLRKALHSLEQADACCVGNTLRQGKWSENSSLSIQINQIFRDINATQRHENTFSVRLQATPIAPHANQPQATGQELLQPAPAPSILQRLFGGKSNSGRVSEEIVSTLQQPERLWYGEPNVPDGEPDLLQLKPQRKTLPPGLEVVPPLQLEPVSCMQTLNIDWKSEPKKIDKKVEITPTRYSNPNTAVNFDFLTEKKAASTPLDLLSLQNSQAGRVAQQLVTEADIELLKKHEYAEEEIQLMLCLGATPMVLQKLVSKSHTKFEPSEAIACIETCIAMGTKEAEKASEKELLLVIGNTGVGKSTAINHFHGCSMKRIDRNGMPVIICDPDSEIKEVALIGHANSKTFVPTVINSTRTGINFCDCPGFFDRRGVEIDISNAVNIRNVIKSAASVKILLLIHYRDSVDPRGVGLNILLETLKNLFGIADVTNELKKYTKNILIGITQAPISIDDYRITVETILKQIYNDGKFPPELRERTFVLDPLGRRDSEGCGREAWITKINQETVAIQNHREIFKTVLTPSNELRLIEISRQISKEMNVALETGEFFLACRHLKNMAYLMVIEREEILTLFNGNVDVVNAHFNKEDAQIRECSRQYQFEKVEQSLFKIRQFCGLFSEFNPELNKKFIELLKFCDEKRIAKAAAELEQCLTTFSDAFFKDDEQQKAMAYQLDQLLNGIGVLVTSAEFIDYFAGCLKIMSEWSGLGTHAKMLDLKLTEMANLCSAIGAEDAYKLAEQSCLRQMALIASTAQKVYEEIAKQRLLALAIEITEQLKALNALCEWQKNGSFLLKVLAPLKQAKSFHDMQTLFTSLMQQADLAQCAKSLSEKIAEVHTLLVTLNNPGQHDGIIKVVYTALFEILQKIETAGNEERELQHAQREQSIVEQFTKDFLSAVLQQNFARAHEYSTFTASMSTTQQKLLKKNREFDLSLKLQLNALLDEFKSTVTWEEHGLALQDKCDKGISGLHSVVAACQRLPNKGVNLGEIMLKISEFLPLINTLEQTCQLVQVLAYTSLISNALQEVSSKLAKGKREQEAREAEEQRKLESETLVAKINNDLLPNNNFKELKEAFRRLEVIAPDHLKMIPLERSVRKHVEEFDDNLLSKNYQPAIDKLRILREVQKEMGAILQKQVIKLDISELQIAILNHITSIVSSVVDEAIAAFASESIKDARAPLKSLTKVGEFFEAVEKFHSTEQVSEIRQQMRGSISKTVVGAFNEHARSNDPQIYVKLLMQTQFLITEIGPRDSTLSKTINDWVVKDTQQRSQDFLSAVGIVLTQRAEEVSSFSRYASELISKHAVFKDARTNQFITNTQDRTSKNILAELQVTGKSSLERFYEYYEKIYWDSIKEMKSVSDAPGSIQKMVQGTITNARSKGRSLSGFTRYSEKGDVLASMLADVFVVWAYLEAGGGSLTDSTIVRTPHSAQVLAIFLLFGLHENQGLKNHLIQVLTGEGKSVIMAGASIAFALSGFSIDAACYTPYLANRDEKLFKQLFISFGVDEQISYGDFDDLSDKFISNKLGDLRSMVRSFLQGTSISGGARDDRKRILLIDEVDVFFGENFLGAQYNSAVSLRSVSYRQLLNFIWSNRQQYAALSKEEFVAKVASHTLTEQFLTEYPGVRAFIDPMVKEMFDGFQGVHKGTHKYESMDDKIGYKDQAANTIRFSTHHRGYTAFAATKEAQEQRLSSDALDNYAAPIVTVGSISYSELPKAYDQILGVTGTLFSLSNFEKRMLDRYGIESRTAIPSVFRKGKLTDVGITVCAGNLDESKAGFYFFSIKKLVEETIRQDRAVLIVFETEERLRGYQTYIRNHAYGLKSIKTNTLLIDSKDQKRDSAISEAATRCRVTEMVREYGRGSDFVCHDSQLRDSGGVLVICAFLPEYESEEAQIRGRTGRQNDPGSFAMILYLKDLEKFGIKTQTEIDEFTGGTRKYLNQCREKYIDTKGSEIEEKIKSAEAAHQMTFAFAKLLTNPGSFSFLGGHGKPFSGGNSQEKEALTTLKKFNGW